MSTTTNPTAPTLVPGRWAVDPMHSQVSFSVRHLGVSKVRGTFADFSAEVVVGDTPATSTLVAVVQTASIDTGNADRDGHVRSADILDVDARPTLTFRSTRIEGTFEAATVHGDLTLGEVTAPATLQVSLGGLETAMDGRVHAGFEATTTISRQALGVEVALPPGVRAAVLGDAVKVEIDLQLLQPE